MNSEIVSLSLPHSIVNIEYRWINPEKTEWPLIIFLHEGLGSLSMWRDYPESLCNLGKFRGLAYSRAGYGKSTEIPSRRKYETDYMHNEAQQTFPAVLASMGVGDESPIFFGHSDGASIALIYASCFPGKVSAVIALAPHYFVEEKALTGITETGELYRVTEMKTKLGRYHDDPDLIFRRWHDAWLSQPFRDWNIGPLISKIQCPVLAIQGQNDEYASMQQIDGIKNLAPQTELLKIENCRHSPHKDQPQIVTSATMDFLKRKLK